MTRAQGLSLIALLVAALVVMVVATVILSNIAGRLTGVESQLVSEFAAPEWEYRIESPDDSKWQQTMDLAGRLGWELVASRRATREATPLLGASRTEVSYEMIFKRRAGGRSTQDEVRESQLWLDLVLPRNPDPISFDAPRQAPNLLAQMPQAFARLQKEIDRRYKEGGKLPDEDSIATIAFTGEMRDPWSLALKYQIIDPAAGKYAITSAGPDMQYGTADDPRLEVDLSKQK
jgi:hypothetical protein